MFQKIVTSWLKGSGVELNGSHPWDPQVNDSRVFSRVALQGSLGMGNTYVKGWWDCKDLPGFFARVLASGADANVDTTPLHRLLMLQSNVMNMQTSIRNWLVGTAHYDLGTELYRSFLDPSLTYTCAFWNPNDPLETLGQAQERKNRLVCRKLKLEPGMRVLNVGAGWGALDAMMAKDYGVSVVGNTISKEQAAYVHEHYRGLSIEHVVCDYRHIPKNVIGKFDRIVSVGMFEQVGRRNYSAFMHLVRSLLSDDGLFVLHTIGGSGEADPWLHQHIFPNGQLPRQGDIESATHGLFVQEHWSNHGTDYARTLKVWRENFLANYPELSRTNPSKYNEVFRRTFEYYFGECEGPFIARRNQLWQMVLSPNGVPGGYRFD